MVFSLLLVASLALPPSTQESPAPVSPEFPDAVQAANEGRDDEALAAFERLASANPNDREARLWIARLHAGMGHQDLAEPVYRSVLLEDPGNIEAMLGVATALLARYEPAMAIEVLDVAEELAPDNDDLLGALGRAPIGWRAVRPWRSTTSNGPYLSRRPGSTGCPLKLPGCRTSTVSRRVGRASNSPAPRQTAGTAI